ncbi:von Willebrand factor A domain-containing protein 7-like [Hydractinia symbiolongicarpus]|uniref:von Willebrand factor A domain-containing protein 7-like n=1 Tax=Hydractinia symbiolongicarpus TaxID=13093 RepID=UPI00254BEF33|nr:von Willebrand factor A domain-containing protein 7-like [Hydractinia symbiolongicarpus]
MLKELKNKSSPNFDLVFGSGGESTLMFTIDTTGSMSAEIYAARQMVSAIINVVKEQPVDCIVAPFNDPSAGPVTKRASSQLEQCVNDIAALRAHGGDDCPEHSYGGMIEALKSQPKFGSSMFVFTDASAKDATLENSLTLKSLAESQSITINFLLTDGQSCLEGDTKYKEIADLTGGPVVFLLFYLSWKYFSLGHVFSLKEKELPNLVAYVKSSLFIDTSIAVKGKSESTKETFQVDSNIFILIITVTVTNNADSVTLLTPNNSPYTQNITTISNIKIFEVVNPVPGEWSITYEDAVGNLTFGVEAISKEPIEFSFNMQAEVKGTTYAVFNPIDGQENDLIIRVAGGNIIQIPTLRVDVVMESGDVIIPDLKLERTDTDFVFRTKFVPPPFPLKLLLKGIN